jgi:hypothetical protein
MFTKRFLRTLGFLILALIALASGVDATLDHMSQAPTQNSVVIYDDHGNSLYAYNGNLSGCTVTLRPAVNLTGPPSFSLHRT